MKTYLKNSIIGLLLAAVISYTTHCFDMILLNEFLVFALLASMALTFEIRNPVITFAVLTGTCIGMSVYDISYVYSYYPVALIFWSASLCKNKKVSPIYIVIVQTGFVVSAVFSVINIVEIHSLSEYLIKTNKIVAVGIVLLVYIVMQSYGKTEDGDPKNISIDKYQRTIMTFAYSWGVIYLIDMAVRYDNTISCMMLFACAVAYIVYYEEPMMYNAFPFFGNFLC